MLFVEISVLHFKNHTKPINNLWAYVLRDVYIFGKIALLEDTDSVQRILSVCGYANGNEYAGLLQKSQTADKRWSPSLGDGRDANET